MALTKIADGGMPAGSVLQVVQDIETAAGSESLAEGAFSAAILSASITPVSTSSKILVLCNLNLSTSTATAGAAALLKRGGTAIGVGDASGVATQATGGGLGANISSRLISNIAMTILDSPSTTSAVTYTAHGKHGLNDSSVVYWNREQGAISSGGNSRVSSTLTLMEIAG
jgi:hypothetical protein